MDIGVFAISTNTTNKRLAKDREKYIANEWMNERAKRMKICAMRTMLKQYSRTHTHVRVHRLHTHIHTVTYSNRKITTVQRERTVSSWISHLAEKDVNSYIFNSIPSQLKTQLSVVVCVRTSYTIQNYQLIASQLLPPYTCTHARKQASKQSHICTVRTRTLNILYHINGAIRSL